MPELVEAHIMSDELSFMEGLSIISISYLSDKTNDLSESINQKIVKVFSVGKRVIFQLENGFLYTVLSMTGKWVIPSRWVGNPELLDNILYYSKYKIGYGTISKKKTLIKRIKGYIYFTDPRTWGSVKYLTSEELESELLNIGIDPLIGEFNLDNYKSILEKKRFSIQKISDFLIDQRHISGIGNYLRAEILYNAKVNPIKMVSSLSEEEQDRIYNSILFIVKKAYQYGGLSISNNSSNYISPVGKPGKFPTKVYNKKLCPLGHTIGKIKAGQTIYYCPIEQV